MLLATIKPSCCQLCNNTKFHKTDNKLQAYKDIINSKIVEIHIKRQRYRCTKCQTKIWDRVVGGDTYKQKTDRYLQHEYQQEEANIR
jgi:hypothetical protein